MVVFVAAPCISLRQRHACVLSSLASSSLLKGNPNAPDIKHDIHIILKSISLKSLLTLQNQNLWNMYQFFLQA
eukprot:2572075-Pyramimonas_sp.AAC.1